MLGVSAAGFQEGPVYQVDDISSFVFYKPADSVVAGYRFSPERVTVALQ